MQTHSRSSWLTRLKLRWARFRSFLAGYEKIVYVLPSELHSPEAATEDLWARRVGPALYRVENIPASNGLNLGDVVRCATHPGRRPVITQVQARSGNYTVRVVFSPETDSEAAVDMIWALKQQGIGYEKGLLKLYLFNIPAGHDYKSVLAYLQGKADEGWLSVLPGDQ